MFRIHRLFIDVAVPIAIWVVIHIWGALALGYTHSLMS